MHLSVAMPEMAAMDMQFDGKTRIGWLAARNCDIWCCVSFHSSSLSVALLPHPSLFLSLSLSLRVLAMAMEMDGGAPMDDTMIFEDGLVLGGDDFGMHVLQENDAMMLEDDMSADNPMLAAQAAADVPPQLIVADGPVPVPDRRNERIGMHALSRSILARVSLSLLACISLRRCLSLSLFSHLSLSFSLSHSSHMSLFLLRCVVLRTNGQSLYTI